MVPAPWRSAALCLSLGLLALAARAAEADSRVALVIGNAAYRDSPLLNPVNDARSVAGALRKAGFEVEELHDASALEMRRAIRSFGEKLRGKAAGLFYFAGHGVQVRGRNFLVPVDSQIAYEDEIEDQSIDITLVLGKMESARARINLVILDACRNNPFTRNNRSAQNGLAAMEAPLGSLIAFATSPGQVASDGGGANGLYTQYLVREIETPGLKVEDVFKRVRVAVRTASANRQIPWENTSLEGDFYFKPPASQPAGAPARREDIDRAVAEALSRSREEADRERQRLEKSFAERLEAERAAIRQEALERIAALEKAAATAAAAPPAGGPSQPLAAPASTAVAAAESPEPLGMPASFMLAMGMDPAKVNRADRVGDSVARGQEPVRRHAGDKWTFQRTLRDGGVTRRNYVTAEVTAGVKPETYGIFLNDGGLTADFGAVDHRVSGGRAAAPFASLELDLSYPLSDGKRWQRAYREAGEPPIEVDAQSTVLGRETVEVPAGRFEALKVTRVSQRSWEPFPGRAERSKAVATLWYVPAVRGAARYEILEVAASGAVLRDETWELDTFTLE